MQAWASECVLEMAVPPVAASAYWTLQSAAAMVATQLGTTLRYIMQQHSMWHMAQVKQPSNAHCWRRLPTEAWSHLHDRRRCFLDRGIILCIRDAVRGPGLSLKGYDAQT